MSPCASAGTIVSTQWSFTSGPSTITLTSIQMNLATLYQNPYSLIPGIYVFTFSAKDSNGISNGADVSVIVAQTPAPSRVSAQFNDGCTRVAITYDSNTNRVGNRDCSILLPLITLTKMGSGCDCIWVDAVTYTILLGTNYTLIDGDIININTGVVGSEDGYSDKETSTSSLSLLAPANEPTVTAIITGQSSIGACRGVELTGATSTGQAGRPSLYTYKWTTTTPTPSHLTSSITAAIATVEASAANMRSLLLPASSIPVNYSYGFVLTTTNWRGVSAISDVFIVTKVDDLVLEAFIAAADGRQVSRKETLLAVVNYDTVSLCDYVVTSAVYTWAQVNGPEIPSILGSTTKTLIIPPYQMTAASGVAGLYAFDATVTVTLSTGRVLTSVATTNWQVIPLPLLPSVIGFNRLVSLFGDSSNITINASLSYDPDISGIKAHDGLTFSWNCTIRSTSLPCIFVSPQPSLNASVVVITTAQLGPDLIDTYSTSDALVFTLTISKDDGTGRTASTVVMIQTTPDYAPSVALRSSGVKSGTPTLQLDDGTTAVRIPTSESLVILAFSSLELLIP
jgi:hypothetical protein